MDTKGFLKRLREVTAKVGLGPFPVFADGGLDKLHRWIGSTGEFDGVGLRDVVNANALAVDELKKDFDNHRTADNSRHVTVDQRLASLEARPDVPFPGGS
jgi:hypothetical protein